MRSPTQITVCVTLCLLSSSYALPFLYHEEPRLLLPRAKYSVVAVDGSTNESSSPTGSSPDTPVNTNTQPEVQVKTVTATPTSPPVSIVTLVATQLVQPVPPAKDNAKANVAVVNVDVAPSSVLKTTSTILTSITSPSVVIPQSTKPSCSSTTPLSVASSTWSSTIAIPTSSTPTSSIIPTSSLTPTYLPSPSPTYPVSGGPKYDVLSPPIITTISTTSRTYDDGFWHTTYRLWNATSTTNPPTQPTVSNLPIW